MGVPRTHDVDVESARVTTIRTAPSLPPAFERPPEVAEYGRVLEAFTGIPATRGNRVEVLRNGDEIFPAMLGAIERAERSIDFMSFVYWTGDIAERFAEALADRAAAGVRVRVLVDAFGARLMEERLVGRLRRAGALVERFRPRSTWKVWEHNMRTHRRVLVCDDRIAFTGGVGIAAEWTGDADDPTTWRDTHFRVEGPAVDGIHAAFYSDWLEVPQPVFDGRDRFPEREPAGDTPLQVIRAASQPGWNDAALTIRALIALARERIRITSAYFRPPGHFSTLLCDAAERGVDVEVLVPGPHGDPAWFRWAAEYHYGRLLEHGVRLWAYQPTMHHGKVVTLDDTVAMVGTVNFDARSLAINEQVALVIHDAAITAVLDDHFESDLAESLELDLRTWAGRGWDQRARELAAHVLSFGLRGGGATRRGSLWS